MRMVDLIIKKRDGFVLSKEEIDFIIKEYCAGNIPHYQMSALLMAIYFRSMNDDEILSLTTAMLNSGDQADLSKIDGIKCDKHSTGGVGDKTTLVVAPICAACGIKMAKMSGRGLGHTGGTLDKLESIPGFNVNVEEDKFIKQVNEIGLAVIGQTQNFTPADKLLYSLRDVTGTVDSIPLITSSIMSKKLASGADYIVLDVKVGKGAFMKDEESATILAKKMVEIGKLSGRCMAATLTDMNEPLGQAVGNSLEVIEAINTLKGHGPKDFTDLCISLSVEILLVTGLATSEAKAIGKVNSVIESGQALEKLRQMIIYQGGNPNVIDDYTLFGSCERQYEIKYDKDIPSYIETIDALLIGEAGMVLGAGRQTKEDIIDPTVGIVLNKKVGDLVSKGDTLATVYANVKGFDEACSLVEKSMTFSNNKVHHIKKIIKSIR